MVSIISNAKLVFFFFPVVKLEDLLGRTLIVSLPTTSNRMKQSAHRAADIGLGAQTFLHAHHCYTWFTSFCSQVSSFHKQVIPHDIKLAFTIMPDCSKLHSSQNVVSNSFQYFLCWFIEWQCHTLKNDHFWGQSFNSLCWFPIKNSAPPIFSFSFYPQYTQHVRNNYKWINKYRGPFALMLQNGGTENCFVIHFILVGNLQSASVTSHE